MEARWEGARREVTQAHLAGHRWPLPEQLRRQEEAQADYKERLLAGPEAEGSEVDA